MGNALKLCLSCLLGACLLALLDADSQSRKLEETLPEAAPVAKALKVCSETLHLDRFNAWQKDLLGDAALWLHFKQAEPAPEPPKPPVAAPVPPPAPELKPAPAAQPEKKAAPKPKADAKKNPKSGGKKKAGKRKSVRKPQVKPAPEPAPAEPEVTPEPEPAPAVPAVTSEPEPVPEEPAVTLETELTEHEIADAHIPQNVRCKVMLMGDSLMEDYGVYFYRKWKDHPGMEFVLAAKFSTGLTRPDYFNWPVKLREVMGIHHPDVLIICMGANDAMPVRFPNTDRPKVNVNEAGWPAAYGEKMKEICDIAAEFESDVLWVGLPVFGGKYAKYLNNVAKAQESACAEMGVPFISNEALMADKNGKFSAFGPNLKGDVVRLRREDQVHMTKAGNEVLLDHSDPLFQNWLKKFCLKHPERCLTDEEAAGCRKPVLIQPFNIPKKK